MGNMGQVVALDKGCAAIDQFSPGGRDEFERDARYETIRVLNAAIPECAAFLSKEQFKSK